jgi:hypothetical protein
VSRLEGTPPMRRAPREPFEMIIKSWFADSIEAPLVAGEEGVWRPVWFNGNQRFHSVSKVESGVRISLSVGLLCPVV